MEHQYKLVFSGQLTHGKTVQDVKPLVAQVLKLPDRSLQQLFNNPGKAIVIKKVESLEQAEVFCKKFNAIGMIVNIKPDSVTSKSAPVSNNLAIVKNETIQHPPSPSGNRAVDAANMEADEEAQTGVVAGVIQALIGWPALLCPLAAVLLFNYSPYPGGYLKYGFVIGIFVFILAFKSFMNRLLQIL